MVPMLTCGFDRLNVSFAIVAYFNFAFNVLIFNPLSQ